MKKKIIFSIIGLIFVLGAVTSTLIYKQKYSPKENTIPGSSSTTSYFNDVSAKSGSFSNASVAQPSSVPLTSIPSGSQCSASNNKKTSDKSSAHPSNSVPEVKNKAPQINYKAPRSQKVAYLTFDDGPSNLTPKILDVLKSKNIKATFFVIGKDDSQSNEMLRRMVREGHTIGVHSWSHKYQVIYSSESGFLNDFNMLRNHIYKVTGVKPNICRFPGGLNNTVCLKYGGHIMPKLYQDVTAMGVKPFDWNVAAHDACKNPPAKELIVQNILSGCEKNSNAVILLHDTNLTTTSLQALPEIIDNLSARGYMFKTLSSSSPSVLFRPA